MLRRRAQQRDLGTSRRVRARLAATLAAGGLAWHLGGGVAAANDPIVVNNFSDAADGNTADGVCAKAGTLDPPGSRCTLRAAIETANHNQGADEIHLGVGTYTLSLRASETVGTTTTTLPPDEDVGDLNITEDLTIVGMGSGKTIINVAHATADKFAGRAFHIGTGGPKVTFTMKGVTVQAGNTADELSQGCTVDGKKVGGGLCIDGAAATLDDCVVTQNSAALGGGIALLSGSSLVLTNSTISTNSAKDADQGAGGGLLVLGGGTPEQQGSVALTQSTVSGNTATVRGGGVALIQSSPLTLKNCTVSGNTAASGGGLFVGDSCPNCALNNVTIAFNNSGYWFEPSTAGATAPVVSNTLLGGNTASDCHGVLNSAGFNLVQTLTDDCNPAPAVTKGNPLLVATLAVNDGTTQTHALQSKDSAAVNQGSPDAPGSSASACEEKDQRGKPRDGQCDIGSYELQYSDMDKDGVPDGEDNCKSVPNPDQDGFGDACDKCKFTASNSADSNCTIDQACPCMGFCSRAAWADCVRRHMKKKPARQHIRDNPQCKRPAKADHDRDHDGVPDDKDNCPHVCNPQKLDGSGTHQIDSDGDGRGDACDNCPLLASDSQKDSDHDGVGNDCDRCPNTQRGKEVPKAGSRAGCSPAQPPRKLAGEK
jgi:CSLREA domain-containing protein